MILATIYPIADIVEEQLTTRPPFLPQWYRASGIHYESIMHVLKKFSALLGTLLASYHSPFHDLRRSASFQRLDLSFLHFLIPAVTPGADFLSFSIVTYKKTATPFNID